MFTIVGASFEMFRLCMFHVKNRCSAEAKLWQSKNILHNNSCLLLCQLYDLLGRGS